MSSSALVSPLDGTSTLGAPGITFVRLTVEPSSSVLRMWMTLHGGTNVCFGLIVDGNKHTNTNKVAFSSANGQMLIITRLNSSLLQIIDEQYIPPHQKIYLRDNFIKYSHLKAQYIRNGGSTKSGTSDRTSSARCTDCGVAHGNDTEDLKSVLLRESSTRIAALTKSVADLEKNVDALRAKLATISAPSTSRRRRNDAAFTSDHPLAADDVD